MKNTHKKDLLSAYQLGDLRLSNSVVMASLTRARANNPDLSPTSIHTIYYADRASTGLILTESTWVSSNAIGFLNIPGIYTQEQVNGWKEVTEAVHLQKGRIFLQLSHSGSVSHPDYFNGELPLGPSAINPQEKVFTPTGFKDTLIPKEYSAEQLKTTIAEYKQAAINAKLAGFDGLELHAQLFTLIPQFLSPATNQRTDEYGGSIENRSRILFEILDQLIEIFPGKRVGVKFTPASFNNGIIQPDESTVPTYDYIFKKLNEYDVAFIELVGPRVDLQDTPVSAWNDDFFGYFRKLYKGTIIANLGFTFESGNQIIADGKADLVSFGMPFIANPDLTERFQSSWSLSEADPSTLYIAGEKGYNDYPKATQE